MTWAFVLLQAAVIAISISIDGFAASFAYGCKKIKISMLSAFIINIICTAVIGLSFTFGTVLVRHIPEWLAVMLSFSILLTIGIIKLFDGIVKSIIRRHAKFNKEIKLSMFNLKLVMNIYANPEIADMDVSKCISPKEAAVLAVSLSLDGLAIGLGAAMIGVNLWALIALTLIVGFIAILLGGWLGNKAANKLRFNISWLAGVILIALAFGQLI